MAEVVELFGDRLEVDHEARVLGDELPDLVDEEVQPETLLVLVDVSLHALREHSDVGLVCLLVVADDVRGRALWVPAHLVEGCGDLLAVEQRRRADLLPGLAAELLDPCLECVEVAFAVEVVLKLGDMLLIAVEVTAVVVERLYECGEYRACFGAACVWREAVDVEQHALRWVPQPRLLHRRGKRGGVGELWEDVVHGALAVHPPVLHDDCHDLEQVRLAASEEARDPCPVAGGVGVVVLVEEALQMRLRLVRDDELLQLASQVPELVRLDDGVDRTVDVLEEGVLQQHFSTPYKSNTRVAR